MTHPTIKSISTPACESFLDIDENTKAFKLIVRLSSELGVSIVKHKFSYGSDENLYELAFLHYRQPEGDLFDIISSEVANIPHNSMFCDVQGSLTFAQCLSYLEKLCLYENYSDLYSDLQIQIEHQKRVDFDNLIDEQKVVN